MIKEKEERSSSTRRSRGKRSVVNEETVIVVDQEDTVNIDQEETTMVDEQETIVTDKTRYFFKKFGAGGKASFGPHVASSLHMIWWSITLLFFFFFFF